MVENGLSVWFLKTIAKGAINQINKVTGKNQPKKKALNTQTTISSKTSTNNQPQDGSNRLESSTKGRMSSSSSETNILASTTTGVTATTTLEYNNK